MGTTTLVIVRSYTLVPVGKKHLTFYFLIQKCPTKSSPKVKNFSSKNAPSATPSTKADHTSKAQICSDFTADSPDKPPVITTPTLTKIPVSFLTMPSWTST